MAADPEGVCGIQGRGKTEMDNMEERKENKKRGRGATEMKAMGCR